MSDVVEYNCEYSSLEDIDKIIENPRNANNHPDRQVDILAKILKQQGWRHPLIVSKRSGFLVAGHGRLAAAKKLGLKEVPIDFQDFESEAQEYAFMIADNKIAELAAHDDLFMIENIKELGFSNDFDFESLGLIDFSLDSIGLVDEINKGDENSEWVGMPEFETADKEFKIVLIFQTEQQREQYINDNNIVITHKQGLHGWTSRI